MTPFSFELGVLVARPPSAILNHSEIFIAWVGMIYFISHLSSDLPINRKLRAYFEHNFVCCVKVDQLLNSNHFLYILNPLLFSVPNFKML